MSKQAINAAIWALRAAKHGQCDHAWADEAIAGLEKLAEQPAHVAKPHEQEPVAGKGKELSEQLKLCARNVAFVASGRVDMSSAAMQEMFALIDHVCVGIDSPPAQRPWVGLTEAEREEIENRPFSQNDWLWFYAQAIEDKLKEKNT